MPLLSRKGRDNVITHRTCAQQWQAFSEAGSQRRVWVSRKNLQNLVHNYSDLVEWIIAQDDASYKEAE